METEELTRLVDGIYKNILDKFNPGARQMITAGKAYLKALHAAAAASRQYVEAVGRLGRQAQQGTWGGCADIGTALMKVVEVYREIQDQQMNILKAFYVDLLVPLETNLEKDTKVVQSEQKRFLQQHKLRSESYSKAAAAIKKQRKKNPKSIAKVGSAMDKEMKSMQVLEEEKTKLDAFCEQSLKNAMTQERRRYGFVLERQCSLAKHWLAHHGAAAAAYRAGLDDWTEAARSREQLPPNVDAMFTTNMRQVSVWSEEEVYASPRLGLGLGFGLEEEEQDRMSVGSALRKTRSVDASCLDVRALADLSPQHLPRAKSDFNLQVAAHDGAGTGVSGGAGAGAGDEETGGRAAAQPPGSRTDPPLARAIYAYTAAGDNQLGFQQGDVLALLGERTKGWQYGENLRSRTAGWFPLAYTEPLPEEATYEALLGGSPGRWGAVPSEAPPAPLSHSGPALAAAPAHTAAPAAAHAPAHPPAHQPARMFGDTVSAHRTSKRPSGSPGLPPPLPAPVPGALSSSHSATFHQPSQGHLKTSASASFTAHAIVEPRSFGPQTLPMRGQVSAKVPASKSTAGVNAVNAVSAVSGVHAVSGVAAVGNVSLHSSNDSGFSNEPPPQPDVDYSDEEAHRRVPLRPLTNEQREYQMKTQSLRRGPRPHSSSAHLTDDQQIMLRNMLEMDKDSQRVKRTKSFWKFGRTTSDEIMEGMSLWEHRDIVDTVPEYKKKWFSKVQKAINSVPEISAATKPASSEKTQQRDVAQHPRETIDRKEMKTTTGIRQSKSLSSIQNEQNKETKSNGHYNPNQDMKRMSTEKSNDEEKEEMPPRNESRSNHSDMTNSSTIKTNFENSFYNDESGNGFIVKTVKRREILQRYDNESSSDENSVASTDPYDCIIVDDHTTPRKPRDVEKTHQPSNETNMKRNSQKGTNYMPEFEEIEIKPPTRTEFNNARADKNSHERSSNEFKTFKDNDKEIKSFSESSETLKYKDNENRDLKRYNSSDRNQHENHNDEKYNGHDEGTLKYKKRSSKEEKSRRTEYNGSPQKEYPVAETRMSKNQRQYDREPKADYSLDRRQMRKDYTEPKPRRRERPNRSYDDSSLPYNGRHSKRYEGNNISYFSDQEHRISKYDYETDSRKAEKTKMRADDARLEDRRYTQSYGESDDHKFDEAMKGTRPQLLPRTKLLKAKQEDLPVTGHTFGPWYDLWGREAIYQ